MQEYHGGQDNNIKIIFKEDFSVTTNTMGPSKIGIDSLKNNVLDIEHYPPSDFSPYIQNLNNYIFRDQKKNDNFLLGNGASELIDLVIRSIEGDSWRPSKSNVQYLEYERSAKINNKSKLEWNNEKANLVCLINPNNPTGDYLNINEMKQYITDNCMGCHILVDESMQPWFGSNWREDSLVSQTEWIEELINKDTYIYIIHSWTKFFSCTGLRYGSLICPNNEIYKKILSMKNPWSVNVLALKYLDACINDKKYIEDTWSKTKELRKYQVDKINDNFPNWKCCGKNFISWIWIDTKDKNIAELAYNLCKYNGTPIRFGKFGYKMDTFIRIAVRDNEKFDDLLKCLLPLKGIINNFLRPIHLDINDNIIVNFVWIDISKIKCHEEYIEERHTKLLNYMKSIEVNKSLPAIIICSKTFVIIDGHHRFSIIKKLNYNKAPCILLNYGHKDIITNYENSIDKSKIITAGLSNEYLPPKSSCHLICDKYNNKYPIQVLSPVVLLN